MTQIGNCQQITQSPRRKQTGLLRLFLELSTHNIPFPLISPDIKIRTQFEIRNVVQIVERLCVREMTQSRSSS